MQLIELQNEKEQLRELFKKAEDIKERERYHALYILSLGYKIKEVSTLFCRDEETICSWVKKYKENKSMKDKPKPGAEKKLNKEIEEEICKLVDENKPEEHGFNCSAWDCSELKKYLKEKHEIDISEERIRQILKRNGFRYIKTNYKFLKADEKERETFKEEFKKGIEENKDIEILFVDEMASKLHPKNGYKWTRDEKPVVETNSSHEKAYVIQAVDPCTGDNVYSVTQKFNSDAFIKILEKIGNMLYEKGRAAMVVLDNHKVHHSKKVNEFLRKNTHIKLCFLPKYSPDLNPVELLWNYIRRKFTNNRLFLTLDELMKHIEGFLESLDKQIVKSVCSYRVLGVGP